MKSKIEKRLYRGLKKTDTATSKVNVYHNYVRPHEALNGQTPASVCIDVQGNNQWITPIQNASKKS
ncbi:MAG: hypothetical protein ACQCN3_06010 [Candidatus Bathyarchaeia archaeon]